MSSKLIPIVGWGTKNHKNLNGGAKTWFLK
jgi:hypothetical protein